MATPTTQNPRLAGARLGARDPFVDGDAFTTGADKILTTQARGFTPTANGTLTIDFIGGIDGRPASTGVAISVLAGNVYYLCFSKVYASSPTGVIFY